MAKKTHVKVRLVPEAKPDSAFYYYVKYLHRSQYTTDVIPL